MESKNASFFKRVFPCRSNDEASSSKRTQDESSGGQEQENEVDDEPRRNKRARTKTSLGLDFLTYLLEGELQTFKEVVNS